MHLDLKPLNIMLDRHDEARVTDFGLAQMRSAVTRTSAGQTSQRNVGGGTGMAGACCQRVLLFGDYRLLS
jgi:serine/threonine protein kinase